MDKVDRRKFKCGDIWIANEEIEIAEEGLKGQPDLESQ